MTHPRCPLCGRFARWDPRLRWFCDNDERVIPMPPAPAYQPGPPIARLLTKPIDSGAPRNEDGGAPAGQSGRRSRSPNP